jgi:Lar family restriction alleviation protein
VSQPSLSPCPFCGGKADIVEYTSFEPDAWIVICNSCGASSPIAVARGKPVNDKLAAAWNRRTPTQHRAINDEQVVAGAFGLLHGPDLDATYEASVPAIKEAMERMAFKTSRLVLESSFMGPTFDLVHHLNRQIEFSRETFGPGERTKGVTDHIERELKEVRAAPHDLEEWIDLVMLSLDGAWRAGHSSVEICDALEAKLTKNMARDWPDWRTADPDKAIEHKREST